MIQINLLPDVKHEYLRTQQVKHTFVVASGLISVVVITLTVLLFMYVRVAQPQHRKNLQKDIDSNISQIKQKSDASKIVTVQGVLEQIPKIQDKKTITSNVFGYLTSFTPRDVAYGEVKLDLAASTLNLSGSAVSYEQAQVLANNLKSAQFTYMVDGSEQKVKPFSAVVFQSLGKAESATNGKPVSFQLSVTFDPVMFDQGISKQSITVDASSEQLLLPNASLFTNGATR